MDRENPLSSQVFILDSPPPPATKNFPPRPTDDEERDKDDETTSHLQDSYLSIGLS
jgi:hypothetical protein